MRTKRTGKVISLALALCMLISLFTCLAGITVSADGTTPDLVEFKGVDWTCLRYTKGWSTIKAGNYRFEMDCKIVSGVPCIQFGSDQTGAAIDGQTNYVETYDSVNNKYIITFTMTADWSGNLGGIVGNYGAGNRNNTTGDAVFACANPTLYLLDESGNPTGSSLINTFASDYYSDGRAGNKWNKRNFGSATATCTSPIPEGYFSAAPVAVVSDLVTFDHTQNNYSRWLYRAPYKTQAAGNYRFTMDCKIFSGTPTINVGSVDNGGNTFSHTDAFKNYTATYDAENYKYTITFTFDEPFDANDRIGVLVGNYGTDGDFACANPTLYLLDESGNPTGDSLINTFDSEYYSSSAAMLKWERRGNYTCTSLPDGYFEVCKHENTTLVEAVDSTCTTHGHGDYTVCADCGAVIDGDATPLELDPDIHEDEKTVPAVASTCSTPGHDAYIVCSGCGALLSGSDAPLALNPENHNGEDTVIKNYVAPGRETKGYTGDIHCKGCDALLEAGKEISPVPASTTMLVFGDNTKLYSRAVYRPGVGAMIAGEKYLYSFDLDIDLTKPGTDPAEYYEESDFWRIYYRYGQYSADFRYIDYSDLDINKTQLSHGYHYDVTFTAPDDCYATDNVLLRFGDTVPRERAPHLKVGNLRLWRIDAEGNKLDEILTDIPDSMSGINLTTDSSAKLYATKGNWYMVSGYTQDVTIVDQEGYFAPIGGYTDCQHTSTRTVAAVASTCSKQGHGEYTVCKICGQIISGSDELLPLDPDNHENTERRGLVIATRTTDGYSGDLYCTDCGTKLEEGYAVAAGTAATKMIELKKGEAIGYTRITYRPAGGKYIAGKKYSFSFDLDIDLTKPDSDPGDLYDEAYFWRVYYQSTTGEIVRIPTTDLDITKTKCVHGNHYVVKYTAPQDVSDDANIVFKFGDCGINGYAPVMKFANLSLWQLSDAGEPETEIDCDIPNIQEEFYVAGQKENARNNGIDGRWVEIYGYTTGVNVIDQDNYFTAHNYESVVTEPTCTEGGFTTKTCIYCGESTVTDRTDATGHKPAEAVKENEKAATYTADGSYDEVVYCSVCNAEISRNTVKVPLKVGTFKITYTLNGGKNNSANPASFKSNAAVTLKTPTRTGYKFEGWYKDSAFKSKITTISKGTAKNVTVYAKWSKITYKITYKLNGGKNGKNPASFNVTTATITLKNPTRAGYKFGGWYTDSKFKKKITKITKGTAKNITVYAKWTAVTYKLTYKLGGGKNGKNPKNYNVATKTFTLKNATRKGYTFKGWYSDSKFKKKVTKVAKGSTGNKTLYAKWAKK